MVRHSGITVLKDKNTGGSVFMRELTFATIFFIGRFLFLFAKKTQKHSCPDKVFSDIRRARYTRVSSQGTRSAPYSECL